MAAPVNSISSIPAGLQMAAVQAQLNAGKSTASSANSASNSPGPPGAGDSGNVDNLDSYVNASNAGSGAANAANPPNAAPATVASLTAATVAADSTGKATPSSSSNGQDQPSPTSFAEAVEQLQDYFQPQQTVSLNVDKSSGESIVKIVDAKTKQLILQIPSKEVLAMAQKLREQGSPQDSPGILVDQQG
jgi:flagellar protein FlaG